MPTQTYPSKLKENKNKNVWEEKDIIELITLFQTTIRV